MIAPVVTPLISLTNTPSGPVNQLFQMICAGLYLVGAGKRRKNGVDLSSTSSYPQFDIAAGIFMIHVICTGGVDRGEAGPGLGTIAGLRL
jgi:hypothetical protein